MKNKLFQTVLVAFLTLTAVTTFTSCKEDDGGDDGYQNGALTWTAVKNSPFGSGDDAYDVQGVAYGGKGDNAKFVAVGSRYDRNGAVAYSPDGIIWTEVTDSAFGRIFGSENINGVTYGGGTFIAFGDRGRMVYSTDGTSLTAVANSTFDDYIHGYLYAIAYGTAQFVTADESNSNGQTAYSPDGINWTRGSDSGIHVKAVGYGGGRFVVGSQDKIAYSNVQE